MSELTQLKPPRKGASAGFYPDPLGGRFARFWDGEAWTLHVGPQTNPDAPANRKLSPPTKVCPRCAVQSETFAGNCPSCGRNYSQSSPLAIVAISVAALILTLGGCAGCVAISLVAVDSEFDEDAITREEFDSIAYGTPRSEVESRFGSPFDDYRDRGMACIDYSEKDGGLIPDFFELCFRGGKLAYKDAY